ncbi:MAG: hypothetical protein R2708_27895 [Vicinamibacterales bacterium]
MPSGRAPALDLDGVVALVRESEGLSVVVEEARAQRLGLEPALRCAWITLAVNSDLHAVGLTAAVAASALGAAGVPCNVVAGTCHDHLFVPVALVHQALQALGALQAAALREGCAVTPNPPPGGAPGRAGSGGAMFGAVGIPELVIVVVIVGAWLVPCRRSLGAPHPEAPPGGAAGHPGPARSDRAAAARPHRHE